jgi:hypothetical protein
MHRSRGLIEKSIEDSPQEFKIDSDTMLPALGTIFSNSTAKVDSQLGRTRKTQSEH